MIVITIARRGEDVFALEQLGVREEDIADDGVNLQGVVVKKPWGHEVEIYRSGVLSISRLMLEASRETSLHCHPTKDVILTVESGTCEVETLAGGTYELRAGEAARIQRGAFHRTRSMEGAVLIEMESPPNKRDLVRLDDRYGRAGQGYEKVAA